MKLRDIGIDDMNYFNIYLEGLAIMDARLRSGMAINEGLFYPISMTAIEIERGISLKNLLLSLNPQNREMTPDLL